MGICEETLVLSTLHKQGMRLLSALETLFTGQPLYPNFAWPVTSGGIKPWDFGNLTYCR
jgi:hypothetical protein